MVIFNRIVHRKIPKIMYQVGSKIVILAKIFMKRISNRAETSQIVLKWQKTSLALVWWNMGSILRQISVNFALIMHQVGSKIVILAKIVMKRISNRAETS